MNLKSANRWQNILLFGGFVIGMVGIAVLDNLYIAILGLAMMAMSIVVWWMYHRCPYCHEQLGRGNPKRCPKCGASFEEIAESGKIGCAECYNVFRDRLMPTIHRIRGAAKHKGKVPGSNALRIVEPAGKIAVVEEPTPIEKKRAELKEAIEKQDFEHAAELRDEIKEMEKGDGNHA